MVVWTNDHRVEVWLWNLLVHWFQVEVAKQNAHDGLHLQQTELLIHASVDTTTEAQVGEWGFVLATLLREALRVEGIGVLEHVWQPHVHSGRRHTDVALWNHVGLAVGGDWGDRKSPRLHSRH